jgi:hypothetical protein
VVARLLLFDREELPLLLLALVDRLDRPDGLEPLDDDFDAGMAVSSSLVRSAERTQIQTVYFRFYPLVTNSRSAFWACRRFSAWSQMRCRSP